MKNSKKIIITLLLCLCLGVVLFLLIFSIKVINRQKLVSENSTENNAVIDNINDDSVVILEDDIVANDELVVDGNDFKDMVGSEDNIITIDVINSFEDASVVGIQRRFSKTVETDGTFETLYDNYVFANIEIGNGQPSALDILNDMKSLNFSEVFRFTYRQENALELLQKFLISNGFDGNIKNVDFDESIYADTGEYVYHILDECSAIDNLMPVDYDEIVDTDVYYCGFTNTLPTTYSAYVTYIKDGKTITNQLTLFFSPQ